MLVDHYNDGKMNPVLEDLAEVGCDVIETLSPPPLGDVDLASAKQRIGARTCLKGHIDQVNIMCFGTAGQVQLIRSIHRLFPLSDERLRR